MKLDNFLGGLTVHEFVQEISSDHSLKTTAAYAGTWEHLDPKPYIRTFESTLKELKKLSDDAESRKSQLEQQVSKHELLHAQNIMHLSNNVQVIIDNCGHLDDRLTNVTQVVSPLGEKLEKAIKRKNVYVKSVELISQYSTFYTNNESTELERLRLSGDWRAKGRAAIMIKNLLSLARQVETKSLPRTVETTSIIEKYSEVMENELLASFSTAYRENDFTKLNEIALILNRFNGGLNVIQSFINQHEYFIDTKQLDLDENGVFFDETFKEKITDPDNHGVFYENSMVKKLDEIETVIKNESKVVKKVFEARAEYVLQLFIERIFAQKIESRVEFLLNASLSLSNLAYVRMLHALYSLIGQFVKDLSEFFQILEVDNTNGLSSTLEHCYVDLFSKTIYDRSKYFDIEKRGLESVLAQKTSDFNIEHDKDIRARALSNKLQSIPEFADVSEVSELNATSANKLSQINSFFRAHLEKEKKALSLSRSSSFIHGSSGHQNNGLSSPGPLDSQDDPFFTLQKIDTMLKCAVESFARVMELVPNKAGDFSYELLEIVLMGTVGSYVESGLETAYALLTRVDAQKDNIQLSFLKYVSKSTEILGLISASIKTVILPLLTNSPTIKKKIITLSNSYIKKCELLINVIMEETIIMYSQRFTNSLSKQKKKDFVPRTQNLMDQDTLPATEIVSVLNSLYSQVTQYLRNDNLKSFLLEVGRDLYHQLIEHYKKFQVSSIGGIMVTKDIIGFQTAIEEWSIQELLDAFATLRELANLFTVQPELLESLTKEGRLANLDKNIISEYISKREDFNHESFVNKFKVNLRL